jgi:hypothetical protein
MSSTPKKKGSSKKKRGRKPESLNLEGDWKDAVKSALKRGKPPAVKPAAKEEWRST